MKYRLCIPFIVLVSFIFINCKKKDTAIVTPQDPTNPNNIVETEPPVQTPVTVNVNANIGGFQEALPARYNLTTKKYPLLIFLHGIGELGNGSTDLSKATANGTPSLIKKKTFPPSFEVNEKSFSFIVLSPQFKNWPSANDVYAMINYAFSKYRIDSTRVYVSGLSMGGGATWDVGIAYGDRIAAIVPICGASAPTNSKAQKIAGFNLPVWAFHNENDSTVTISNSIWFVTLINSFNPSVPAKLTLWPTGGHDAWTKATKPDYKENGKNMYEWMLQYTR